MKAKVFLTMIMAVLFNAMTGAVFGMALGVSPVAGAVGANAVALAVSGAMPVGVAREGVLKEIWTGELVKALPSSSPALGLTASPTVQALSITMLSTW